MIIPSIQSLEKVAPIATVAAAPAKSEAQPIAQNYYYSPALTVDPKTETAVLEYRNATTGAVIAQYPSQQNLDAYAKQQTAVQSEPAKTPADNATSADKSLAATAKPATTTVSDIAAPNTISTANALSVGGSLIV